MKNFNFKTGNAIVNFQFKTGNTKTGALIQNYIIPADWLESDAKISTLSDKAVCFDCPHSKDLNKSCYVRKGQSEMGLASKG